MVSNGLSNETLHSFLLKISVMKYHNEDFRLCQRETKGIPCISKLYLFVSLFIMKFSESALESRKSSPSRGVGNFAICAQPEPSRDPGPQLQFGGRKIPP